MELNQSECDARTAKRRQERQRKKEAKRLAKIRIDLNEKAGITDTSAAPSKAAGAAAGGGGEPTRLFIHSK